MVPSPQRKSSQVATGVLGRASAVGAVLTVQAVAFGLAYAAGHPTMYVAFALLTAGILGYATGEGWFGIALGALAGVLLLALGLPLAMFLVRQDPSLVVMKARDPAVHRMLYLTVYGPLLTALVAVGFGVPLAYLLSMGFPGRTLVESLVDLPLVVPHSVAGVIVLFGFGRQAAFPWLDVLGTVPGMVLALTFVSAPYAVNGAREAFEAVDRRLTHAARSHGAGPLETFRRVTLPLATRGVVTGGVLAWARAVSEFGAVAVVAYTVTFLYPGAGVVRSQHAPVYVFQVYRTEGLDAAGAVAVVLLGLSAVIFLSVRWLAYDGRRFPTGGGP